MNERKVWCHNQDRARLDALQPIATPSVDRPRGLVKKPWGFEYEVACNAQESVWKLQLNPGAETSMHCHPAKETVLIVIDGVVEFSTLHETLTLGIGERVWIERGAFHRTATKAGATLIEIESPPDKLDLVRLSDKYGREGQGYEQCA